MAKHYAAIVGRPNVGKSMLFNKLTGRRTAIVEDTPGVTRDRIYGTCEWNGKTFELIDTGGIEPSEETEMLKFMRRQAEIAIETADVIIMVTDVKVGVTAADLDVANMLKRSRKPVIVAVNKCDTVGPVNPDIYEFYDLGLGDPVEVSAIHGFGTGDLLDFCAAHIPDDALEEPEDDTIKVAIVGKPNVGKSSLMNALLREERAIVTDIPGTTRDSIEEYADIGGVPLRIIDTAGIRETDDAVERIGVEKARGYIERAALVLALFDGAQPLGAEDEEILSLVAGRPALLLLTKSDLPPVTTPAALAAAYARCAGGDAAAPTILAISAREEQGLSALAAAIGDFAGTGSGLEEGSFVSDERSAALLRAADAQLGAALKTIGAGLSVDFISIDLRAAWEKLGEITGETVGEDIIDEIFSKFCIGK